MNQNFASTSMGSGASLGSASTIRTYKHTKPALWCQNQDTSTSSAYIFFHGIHIFSYQEYALKKMLQTRSTLKVPHEVPHSLPGPVKNGPRVSTCRSTWKLHYLLPNLRLCVLNLRRTSSLCSILVSLIHLQCTKHSSVA